MTDEEHLASLKEWTPDASLEIVNAPSASGIRRWTGFLYRGEPYRFGVSALAGSVADADDLLRVQAEDKLIELGALPDPLAELDA